MSGLFLPPDGPDLDQTEAALSGPPTAITPTVALRTIEHWRTVCLDASQDFSVVIDGLDALRTLLGADTINGAAVGAVLGRLARATRDAAALSSDVSLSPRLARIASHLDRAARGLS